MKPSINIFWFRRDLRINDNHGLYQALLLEEPVLPIFIFDTHILHELEDKNDRRLDFIVQALQPIHQQLKKQGSGLTTFYSTPADAFKELMKEYHIKKVFTNHDYEPYAIKRDLEINELCKKNNIHFLSFKDQVIFEKNEVVKPDGKPYTIFTPYSRTWKAMLHNQGITNYPSEKKIQHTFKFDAKNIHSVEELGFKRTDIVFELPVIDKKLVSKYDETRNLPSIKGTTRIGIHLRFGTISTREMAQIAIPLNEQWLNELIWREFFMMILFHFPHVINGSFKPVYDQIQWRNNEKEFYTWCKGETGYPIVDAGMRELNETGFMHNRVRMIVASFLTKDLLIDWRWGEAYFAQKLLDYDLSANNGNWQWAAGCGCDAAPYFRIFNPTEQTKKFDPQLLYIRKWIKDYDRYMIRPIVEHDMARKRCLEVYKKALVKE